MIKKCKDCGSPMRELQETCRCGWSEKAGTPNKNTGSGSHLCAAGCGKAGTIAPGTIKAGPMTKWYCRDHYNK